MRLLGAALGTVFGLITGLSFLFIFGSFLNLVTGVTQFTTNAIPALLTGNSTVISIYALTFGLGLVPSIIAFLATSLIVIGIASLFYFLAKTSIPATSNFTGPGGSITLSNSNLELFCRGVFCGITLGTSSIVLSAILLNPLTVSPLTTFLYWLIIGLLFLSLFISTNPVFKGFISWFCWVIPTCWIVNVIGLFLITFSFIFSSLGITTIFGIIGISFSTPRFNWTRGTFIMIGGFTANTNSAYNLGNFIFISPTFPAAAPRPQRHEEGHTLNLSTFGWVFHFIGFLEEMAFGSGSMAYSELLAESNRRSLGNALFGPSPFITNW